MKDLCIVGFGLAGFSLARHAELANLSFDIISDSSQLSSRVAGGILNPVAVKPMKPVWNVEYFLNYAKSYYITLGHLFDKQIYQDIPLQVFIHNIEQENNWYEAYDKPRLKFFLNPKLKHDKTLIFKTDKFGMINAGLVNLSLLFSAAREYYTEKANWVQGSFLYNNILFKRECINYNSQDYKHIVFCEGFGVTENPYFKDLGIYGNKGDYLIIKSKELKQENIVKARYFLIPLGGDLYKFGATYQRQPLNHLPSNVAKVQMIEGLNKMINVPYKILDQVCGIRPTTKDRKPILGTHKTHKRLHILNGFGSRGVMTSPLLGKNLLSHIFDGTPLDKEISIQRIYAQI